MKPMKMNLQLFAMVSTISAYETDVNTENNTSYVYVTVTTETTGPTYNLEGSAFFNITASGQNNTYNVGNTYFTINKTTKLTLYSGKLGPFKHNDDGFLNPVNVSAYIQILTSRYETVSTSCNMTTIPRASKINNTGNFYVQDGFKLNLTIYSNSFDHRLTITQIGTNNTVSKNVVNNQQITFTNTLINNFINSFPVNDDKSTFELKLFTYSDVSQKKLIGIDTKTLTGVIKATNETIPSINGNIETYEKNNLVFELTNEEKYIKDYSILDVVLDEVPITKYNSTLSKVILNNIYEMNITEQDVKYTINNVNTSNIKIEAIDSRGLSSFVTSSVEMITDYHVPLIDNVQVNRTNGVEETAYLNFNANLWKGNFGNGDNTLTECKYRVKKSTSIQYSNWFDITGAIKVAIENQEVNNLLVRDIQLFSDGESANFDFGQEYDIELYITDGITGVQFNSSGNIYVMLDDGIVLDNYVKNNDGYQYAINGMVDKTFGNGLQVYGSLHVNGVEVVPGGGGGGDTTPIGVILEYPVDTPPDNWLICDGSAVSRTQYSDLFAIIGTTYGSGNGTTTFNLPNIKGRVPVGKDNSQSEFSTLGKIGGSKYLQKHNHTFDGYAYIETSTMWGTKNNADGGDKCNSKSMTTKDSGTGESGNLQPYIVVNYIIKATKEVATSSVNEIYNAMWPIGRGFIDFTETDYSNWLGFTWERELVGMTAVGLDTTQTEFNTIGKTGGSKELQEHVHNIADAGYEGGTSGDALIFKSGLVKVPNYIKTAKSGTGNSGNLQPYKVVAYWKRVA